MTDNEKAATFIGWKDEICPGVSEQEKDCVAKGIGAPSYGCHVCNQTVGWDCHHTPAPDMSRHENYMLAFEQIAKTHKFAIQINTVFGEEKWVVAIYAEVDGTIEPSPFFGDVNVMSAGSAAVEALAALYDVNPSPSSWLPSRAKAFGGCDAG